MRFLLAFGTVLGYASAGLIAPLVYGADTGAIDAIVAAQDYARAFGEGQARAAKAVVQANTKAARQAAETSRDFHENAYWGSVAASQNYVANAQSQAAALSGAAVAVHATHLAAPVVPGVAPLAYAGYRLPGSYGLGLHNW